MSIDLEGAVTAHVSWKIKLQSAIDGNGDKLDPSIVCQDNKCDLGKWIYGDGAAYKAKASYEPLRNKHAVFHKCAAEVVTKSNAGDRVGAQKILDGDFRTASMDTITAIRALKKDVS